MSLLRVLKRSSLNPDLDERDRIQAAYDRLEAKSNQLGGLFGHRDFAHIARIHERYFATLSLLSQFGYRSLADLDILDVGCGDGPMLRQFIQWGASPARLAGIELRCEAADYARAVTPNVVIQCGSAETLPWPDVSFDLVCQHTVFTSIFDPRMKQSIAAEMVRVLRPGGAVLWYDFCYNNPANSDVRGVRAGEIRSLFPQLTLHLRRITLAPFLARRIPGRFLPVLYPLLAGVPVLRTHYLGLFIKPI
jgi:SAM-dependent methyltransferase